MGFVVLFADNYLVVVWLGGNYFVEIFGVYCFGHIMWAGKLVHIWFTQKLTWFGVKKGLLAVPLPQHPTLTLSSIPYPPHSTAQPHEKNQRFKQAYMYLFIKGDSDTQIWTDQGSKYVVKDRKHQ